MQVRVAVSTAAAILIAALSPLGSVEAQAMSRGRGPTPAAIRLQSLSQARAERWALSTPVVHCGPAPLVERPTAAAERAHPKTAPLEATFLDAATPKYPRAGRPPATLAQPR